MTETSENGKDSKIKDKSDGRHRLLKKRQQQRRGYLEKHNVSKQRRQLPTTTSTPYNFCPAIALDDVAADWKVAKSPRTLSARIREVRQTPAPFGPETFEKAFSSLAGIVNKNENKVLGVWRKLPSIQNNKPTSRPVLTGTHDLGKDEDDQDISLHFKTVLPPLANKPNELNFRDVIYRKEPETLRELIRQRRDQETLTVGELNHALLIAVNRRETEMVEILLMSGAEAGAFGKYNPLIVQACFTNNADVVELLLRFGAEPNIQQDPQYTPLYFACHRNNFDMVKILVKNGADVKLASRDNLTPLMAAARAGNVRCVRYLFFHCSSNINERDRSGKSALGYATSSGKIRLVQFLLKNGAELYVADKQGETPYIAAMKAHDKEMAQLLLPPNITDRITDDETGHRNTMLWYAVKCGHVPSVRDLLSRAADVGSASEGNPFPIIKLALDQAHLDMVQLLAPLTDLNLPVFVEGPRALNSVQYFIVEHLDVDSKIRNETDVKILQCLVDNGSDINALTYDDQTVFLECCSKPSTANKAEVLVQLGANPNVLGADGCSALWYACKKPSLPLLSTLIDGNFDMTLSDVVGSNNLTPMQMLFNDLVDSDSRTSDSFKTTCTCIIALASAGACLTGISKQAKVLAQRDADDSSSDDNSSSVDDSDSADSVSTPTTSSPAPPTPLEAFLDCLSSRSLTVRPLQEIAKLAIKKTIGHRQVNSQIEQLPIPAALKAYLNTEYVDGYLKDLQTKITDNL